MGPNHATTARSDVAARVRIRDKAIAAGRMRTMAGTATAQAPATRAGVMRAPKTSSAVESTVLAATPDSETLIGRDHTEREHQSHGPPPVAPLHHRREVPIRRLSAAVDGYRRR